MTSGDKIMVAADIDSGYLYFGKNGIWLGSANPSGGSGANIAFPGGNAYAMFVGVSNVANYVNFGQQPYFYNPPAGFLALHTGNLPATTPTVSGTFTGNLAADGPFAWLGGAPETLTINGNPVAFGSQADRLANGFKVRNATATFNNSGSNTWSATYLTPASNSSFKYQLAK
jgi:hypothetical protein